MPEEQPFPEPIFDIDTNDATVRLRLDTLEHNIKEDPYRYLHSLVQLGRTATTEAKVGEVDGDATATLNEFFKERDDRSISFDPDTEAALGEDEDYLDLLDLLRQHPSRTRSIGKGGFEKVPDPEADTIRDRIRILRLKHFIGRVISWQEQNSNLDNEADGELRSVS